MRILLATGIYPPDIGGPATYAAQLFEHLPKRGMAVGVVTYGEKVKSQKSKVKSTIQNSKVIFVPRSIPKGLRHLVYFLKVLWYGRRADIIYAFDGVSAGLPAFLAAKILSKPFLVKIVGDYAWEQRQVKSQKSKVKSFVTVEEFQNGRYDFLTEFRRKIQMYVVRRAHAVITPSAYLKRIVTGWGVMPENVTVVPNAVMIPLRPRPREILRQELGLTGLVILSVGRLVPWKGFATLINLMTELGGEVPEARLFVVGAGPEENQLQQRARELGLAERVFFVGSVGHEKLWEYLWAADCFVLNTAYEGFSHLVIEAMGAGLPVVTTAVGGNPEVVSHGRDGFLVPFDDRRALKDTIAALLHTQTVRTRIGLNARRKAAQFTTERMIERLMAVCGGLGVFPETAGLIQEIQPQKSQALLMVSHVSALFRDEDIARMNRYAQDLVALHIILRHPPEVRHTPLGENLFIHATQSRSKLGFFIASWGVGKRILRSHIVRGYSSSVTAQDPFEHGIVAWGLARHFQLPLELQLHTDCFSPWFSKESFRNKIRVRVARFLLPRAQQVRVVSERLRRGILALGIPEKRVVVRPVWVDYSTYRNFDPSIRLGAGISKYRGRDLHRRYPQFDFIILMVGRLTREKNVGLAVEALSEVVKKFPKTGLVIVGDGEEKSKIKNQISNMHLGGNVILEGWIEPEYVPLCYKTADLYLLTSRYEGYGRSVMEARAAGSPIVMTDVGVAGFELKASKKVRVVPVGDKEKLVEAILKKIKRHL